MFRADSARLYGSGTPTDLSRLTVVRVPRAYGLRSGSSPTGYYPAYVSRPSRKSRKETVDTVSNLVAPVVPDDDDAPLVRYTTDYASERKIAGVIRMGSDFA